MCAIADDGERVLCPHPGEMGRAREVIGEDASQEEVDTSEDAPDDVESPFENGEPSADSAEAAIVSAVNRGGDADTIGAVAGAVAGARFGAEALPESWLDVLDHRDELADLAEEIASVEFDSAAV